MRQPDRGQGAGGGAGQGAARGQGSGRPAGGGPNTPALTGFSPAVLGGDQRRTWHRPDGHVPRRQRPAAGAHQRVLQRGHRYGPRGPRPAAAPPRAHRLSLSLQAVNTCPAPCWWTWSPAPWTRCVRGPSVKYSGRITSCSVSERGREPSRERGGQGRAAVRASPPREGLILVWGRTAEKPAVLLPVPTAGGGKGSECGRVREICAESLREVLLCHRSLVRWKLLWGFCRALMLLSFACEQEAVTVT